MTLNNVRNAHKRKVLEMTKKRTLHYIMLGIMTMYFTSNYNGVQTSNYMTM